MNWNINTCLEVSQENPQKLHQKKKRKKNFQKGVSMSTNLLYLNNDGILSVEWVQYGK